MTAIDPIEVSDLAAYVDDQLEVGRRIEVEDWLSRNPKAAAEVMADMRVRDELRLAVAGMQPDATRRTSDLARRLQARRDRARLFQRLRPLAAAALLLAAGWFANGQLGMNYGAQASSDVPEYVAAAIEANRTSVLRARMTSQIEAPDYDAAELLAETAIRMPTLPASWRVTDVQVYPSKFGPSVEMAIDADELGMVSLFAVRPGQSLFVDPQTQELDGTATAHWQFGDIAYALVSRAEPGQIARTAAALFDTHH